jgi:hypothetical protein
VRGRLIAFGKATEDRLRRAQPPSALLSRSQYVPDCTVKVVVLLDILIEAQSNKLPSGRAYERRHAPSHQCRLQDSSPDDKRYLPIDSPRQCAKKNDNASPHCLCNHDVKLRRISKSGISGDPFGSSSPSWITTLRLKVFSQ